LLQQENVGCINKTFGCCGKIFGCSNKNLFVVPNFVAVTKPFFSVIGWLTQSYGSDLLQMMTLPRKTLPFVYFFV